MDRLRQIGCCLGLVAMLVMAGCEQGGVIDPGDGGDGNAGNGGSDGGDGNRVMPSMIDASTAWPLIIGGLILIAYWEIKGDL